MIGRNIREELSLLPNDWGVIELKPKQLEVVSRVQFSLFCHRLVEQSA